MPTMDGEMDGPREGWREEMDVTHRVVVVGQACLILLGQNCWVLSKNLLSSFLSKLICFQNIG